MRTKEEYKEFLENADKAVFTLSKLKGDYDVIAALLSVIAGVIIGRAQYELEREDNNE